MLMDDVSLFVESFRCVGIYRYSHHLALVIRVYVQLCENRGCTKNLRVSDQNEWKLLIDF